MAVFDDPIAPMPSKSDLVYEQIRAAIFDGRLKPGDRLNADGIGRELHVSKIPVREALKRLEAAGVIVQEPFMGARVARISPREWRGVFLIRIELEGLAARLAAESISEADVAELRTIHHEMESLHAAGELEPMSAKNRLFHRVIGRAAGYKTLSDLVEQVLLTLARTRVVMEVDPGVWRQVIDEHAEIILALSNRDPVAAEEAVQTHFRRQLESTLQRRALSLDADEWPDDSDDSAR